MLPRTPLLAGAVVAALLLPFGASAQDRVQETVVVTGTAASLPFESLARTVLVITREELARLPVASVVDALRLSAGVDVRARGTNGMQADFSLRGANFAQALVLVDGRRMNNSQTGHHNGDLPVALDEVDRVEVLLGPGSSLYGADAFGGTINIITRQRATPTATASLGEHDLFSAAAQAGTTIAGAQQTVAGAFTRSSGFMYDREFQGATLGGRTRFGTRTSVDVGFSDRAFGANGFYGNSPSKEWTQQWMTGLHHAFRDTTDRALSLDVSYRTFRDRFLWDVRRPGLFENTHRTHAALATVSGRAPLGRGWHLNGGLEQAADWIRSTNLGDHDVLRTGAFAEGQGPLGTRASLAGGVRVDAYSTFGVAANPSVSGSYWLSAQVRARVSLARAFRVPTFTERYYTDPAHRANSNLDPETSWGADAAVDWIPQPQWVVTSSVFGRRERNVIDWVKAAPTDVWQTRNILRVRSRGAEFSARRAIGSGTTLSVSYAFTDVEPEALAMISKYTLDYAPHAFVVSGGTALPAGFALGGRVEVRKRTGRDAYTLVDVRVSRQFGRLTVFADGTNLLDAEYQEIRGVPMPGRWLTAGVEIGRR